MKTVRLRVPSPADPPRLDRFLAANLHRLSRKQVKGLIDAGQVRIGRRTERRAGRAVRPAEVVEVDWRPSLGGEPPRLREEHVIARGDGWWAIQKPSGLPSHRTEEDGVAAPERLADVLGVTAQPVHRLDRGTSGVLVLAVGEAVGALSSRFEAREVAKRYLAVVHPPPADGDLVDEEADMHASVRVLRRSRDGTRAEVEVRPREGRTHQVRRLLAAAGSPVIGDLEYGDPLPGGAPRLALHCARLAWGHVVVEAPAPDGWDALLEPPAEVPSKRPRETPREPRERRTSRRTTLRVSKATARILRGGHPWVLRDRDTGPTAKLRPGALVELVDPRGDWVATAVVDPAAAVCARVVSLRAGTGLGPDDWRRRAARALERREGLLSDPATTAYRLIHGEADGLPGLFVDQWGPVLVATRTSMAVAAFRSEVHEVLRGRFRDLPLYEKDHLVDLRRRADAGSGDDLPGRWIHGRHDGDVDVSEAGLTFRAAPFAGLTTGFYPDQRANRALLRGLDDLPGATVANLFAHTGAFSVALAAAGAAKVFSVDLSPRYLAAAADNLRRNGLDPDGHPCVAEDAVKWLDEAPPLDGVVLDPPVFAQGRGRGRGFSARGDYRAMVATAAKRLRDGGWMLCCRNLRAERGGKLRGEVEAGIRDAGRRVAAVRRAGPSPDFPVVRGFPEGTSFHGVFARVSA